MNYKKLNQIFGWLVFLIATAVYFITIEDTVSLWDCGEYVTTAYKLEVGHPPGAPLFMIIGRMFSFFADPENVAVCINRVSAVSSSLSILFMFWSITLLAKKIALKSKLELSNGEIIAIIGSGFIGSMAYMFTDSFWFSAVEGEVYAMASLFTAIIFWAILKWDEEMAAMQHGSLDVDYSPDRWLLLIMFLLGLAIGVHLLGILVVPAIGFVIYFRYKEFADLKGILLTGILSILVLGFIQEGVIPGSISLASSFEVAFRNSLGLPFFSGTLFFFGMLVFGCIYLMRRARKKGQTILYNATLGLIFLLIGYGSFAVIVIRSNANTPLDENDPENLVTLKSYLKREQYGSSPILKGPYWNSTENDHEEFGNRSPIYLRRFVVTDENEAVIKAFRSENDANKYAAKKGAGHEVSEKYFESNVSQQEHVVPTYSQNTLFPRMFNSDEPAKVEGYKKWSGYGANVANEMGDDSFESPTDIGNDEMRLPTFGENMTYFANYQVNWMYWRYFMWNFVGRQNDVQGDGDNMKGNWASGVDAVDSIRLGAQNEDAPYFTAENKSNNKFFFLPLILGLIGMIFHFYRAPKDGFVVLLAFIFTGIAIVVYLNQKTNEPRERDYAFAGSFYFFALWIGLGVYGLYEAFTNFSKKEFKNMGIIAAAGLVITLIIDSENEVSKPITISWVIITGISILAILVMAGLRKVIKSDSQGASVAILLGLFIPVIMGMQGWDDHDRSLKTSARDSAANYLMSCEKNAILFTNGDNDTFPLWYMQEVEGMKTDVRVCNLSLMQTDWYTDQMKMKAYNSAPLPIKFTEDQILMNAGYTDQVLFVGLADLFQMNVGNTILKKIVDMRVKNNRALVQSEILKFNLNIAPLITSITTENVNITAHLEELKQAMISTTKKDVTEEIISKFQAGFELLSGVQGGSVKFPEGEAQKFYELLTKFEESWDYANIDDAMAFVRDDENIVNYNETNRARIMPSKGLILPVDKQNCVKSGIIKANQKVDCLDEIRFKFDSRGITREQVMMLDILANNNWERGIYFSSPQGSDVSSALYQSGCVKQNGMTYELNPIDNRNDRLMNDKMYDNLMTNYVFGEMKNPNVLTDYYTRRTTIQYRSQFLYLAQDYLRKADFAQSVLKGGQPEIERYRLGGRPDEAKEMEKALKTAKTDIAIYKKKAANLLKRSLEVMPANIVIDGGEPNQTRQKYNIGSEEFAAYSDGVLQDYVALMFQAGDKKGANDLGMEIARQMESIFNFYEKSDVYFVGNNPKDLFAALDNYFNIYTASMDPEFGDPTGVLAKRTQAKLNYLYSKAFLKISNELKARAIENGESVQRSINSGLYAAMLFSIQDNVQAIGIHYGMLKAPKNQVQEQNNSQEMDLEKLKQQMVMPDSVNQ